MQSATMKVFLLLTFVAAAQAVAWITNPRGDDWWKERHEGFKQNTAINRENISIIFYGDSITEGWGAEGKAIFDSKYVPLGAVNYGISGDRTEHVLYRIEDGETDNLSPKLVVLKIGTNNLAVHTNDEIVRGIKAVADSLLERLSTAKLLLLGVLARKNHNGEYSARIADINIKISKFYDGNRIFYLNMFNQFSTAWGEVDGSLFMGDKVHLVAAGYQKWADTMDDLFNKLRQ